MALTPAQQAAINRAKRQQTGNGGNRFVLIVCAVLALAVGGGYAWSLHRDSQRQSQQAEDQQRQKLAETRASESFLRLLMQWEDAKRVAASSPRIALGPAITQLQLVRGELALIALYGCKEKARTHYLAAMQATVDGYLDFMGQTGSDSAAAAAIAAAESLFTEAAIVDGTCVP